MLSDGKFELRYEGNTANLTWSKPTGDYTRQAIEQWTNKNRQRRETETECKKKPQCIEHEVDKDQTTLTIHVEHQDYIFMLVLYDGGVPVSRFTSQVVEVPTNCKFTVKHILYFKQNHNCQWLLFKDNPQM